MVNFHKLQVSEGQHIPIFAVVMDEEETKHTYKFSYDSAAQDFSEPGVLESEALSLGQEADREHLEVCAEGIERHTEYEVSLPDE